MATGSCWITRGSRGGCSSQETTPHPPKLPDEVAGHIQGMIEQGMGVMKRTLEK